MQMTQLFIYSDSLCVFKLFSPPSCIKISLSSPRNSKTVLNAEKKNVFFNSQQTITYEVFLYLQLQLDAVHLITREKYHTRQYEKCAI